MASNGKPERLRLAVDSVRVAQYRRRYFWITQDLAPRLPGGALHVLSLLTVVLILVLHQHRCELQEYRRRYFLAEILVQGVAWAVKHPNDEVFTAKSLVNKELDRICLQKFGCLHSNSIR